MKYVVRPAVPADLPAIHQLQNIPHREKVFVDPLPPLKNFVEESKARIETGRLHYYMFEENSVPTGFIKYESEEESTTIWGKWLSTLVYACGVLAFDDLQFSKLTWYTRAANKPMIRTCEKMKFRRTDEKDVLNITEGFAFIAIGKLIYFEITAAEFHAQRHWMKDLALPLEIRFRDGTTRNNGGATADK